MDPTTALCTRGGWGSTAWSSRFQARETLEDRGHEVAVFNPAPAPAKRIADAGLRNLPMPTLPMPAIAGDMAGASAAWDVEEMFGHFFSDEDTLRAATAAHAEVIPANESLRIT